MFKATLFLVVCYCLAFSLAQALSKTEFEAAADQFIATHQIGALTVVAFNKDNNQVYKFQRGNEIPSGFTGGPKAVSDSSSWGVASVSKMYVWMAIMALLDDSKITSLDADVNLVLTKGVNGIPADFSIRHPQHSSVAITWRMLMQHSAGFVRDLDDFDNGSLPYAFGTDYKNVDTLTSYHVSLFTGNAATQSGKFYEGLNGVISSGTRKGPWAQGAPTPGTFHSYSNVGTAVAGWLIEQASGQTFEAYIKSRIIDRAGTTGGFLISEAPNIVYPQFISNGATTFAYESDGNSAKSPYYTSADYPSGSFRTTPTACAEVFRRLILRDGEGILTKATNDIFVTQKNQLTNSLQFLGWEEAGNQQFLGHTGSEVAQQARIFASKSLNQGFFLAHTGEDIAEDSEEDFNDVIINSLAALLSNTSSSASPSATSSASVGASQSPTSTVTPSISVSATSTKSRGAPDSPSATRTPSAVRATTSPSASATSSISTGASPSTSATSSISAVSSPSPSASATSSISTGSSTSPSPTSSISTGSSPSSSATPSTSTASTPSTSTTPTPSVSPTTEDSTEICHRDCRAINKACKANVRNSDLNKKTKKKAIKACKAAKKDCRRDC